VRIYEAPEIMNLSQWILQQEIQLKIPASCLSWNPSFSRLHPPMLAGKIQKSLNHIILSQDSVIGIFLV